MTTATQLGNYTLLSRIGEGAMGVVWRAEHVVIGRAAAIKVLSAEAAANKEIVARFFDEARAAHKVGHESIVEVYDCGIDASQGPYLVMELLEGESLGERLAQRRTLPLAEVTRLVERVSEALDATHAAGIVHRDLKPDNLFLCLPDDRVKVLDFGVAQLQRANAPRRTHSNLIVGTPLYMSPEQCASAKHVDARSDIYALGAIAYEALCGRPPFEAEGAGRLMAMHQYEPVPDLYAVAPDVGADAAAAVTRALAKKPSARYERASHFAAALRRALEASLARAQDERTIPKTMLASEDARAVPPTRVAGRDDRAALLAAAISEAAAEHAEELGVASTVAAERSADEGDRAGSGDPHEEVTFREVTSTPQTRSCPRCRELLVPTSFAEDIEVDRCLSCRGIWLDFGEAGRLVASSLVGLKSELAPQLPSLLGARVGDSGVDCPNCGCELDTFELRAAPDTEVDRCGRCGGMWLDDGELATMQRSAAAQLLRELAAAGGKRR
ncbi:MAG: protein kinase [Myxococcales bacterium]|nr:protein kinase [Myxococcales bacterium]